jgi:hypothetical protein
VGEQLSQRDCLGDRRPRQVDVAVDRGVQVEATGTDFLQHGHADEQRRDRCRVEPIGVHQPRQDVKASVVVVINNVAFVETMKRSV